jgi:purine-binding chemotaxis protein CheW
VRGVAIIRGIPTPVVELAVLLGAHNDTTRMGIAGRLVTLRLGERQAALSVDAVSGVRELDALTIRELPPLLQGASNNFIETIATLDARMLVILQAGWRLPDAIWESLAGPGAPRAPQGEIVT